MARSTPGVLDLDRHHAPVGHHRPVHLADRCCGDRHRIPVEEEVVHLGAELGADDLLGEARCHRSDVLVEAGQRSLRLEREAVGSEAEHLPELHDRTLHLPELLGHVGGAAHREPFLELTTAFLVGADPPELDHTEMADPPRGEAGDAGLARPPFAALAPRRPRPCSWSRRPAAPGDPSPSPPGVRPTSTMESPNGMVRRRSHHRSAVESAASTRSSVGPNELASSGVSAVRWRSGVRRNSAAGGSRKA